MHEIFFHLIFPCANTFFVIPPPPHKFSKGPSLIRPLFDFADTIWGDRDQITLMRDLLVLQNKAAKVILDLSNYASSTNALKHSDALPYFKSAWYIKRRTGTRQEHRYITTFKYIHGLVDHNFNILRNSDIHSYNTRRRNDSVFLSLKGITEIRDLLYQSVKEWNILGASFKEINSLLLVN